MLRKLTDVGSVVLLVIIGVPLFVLAIPFVLILMPIGYFQRKKFEKKYVGFLAKNDGKNFFCYNNRKNSKKYVEEAILPNLKEGIEIVYLNGQKIESSYDAQLISEALYALKHYNKFPHLMKIRNGQLIDKSINHSFYGVLNMNKSKEDLLNKIDLFFNLVGVKENIL